MKLEYHPLSASDLNKAVGYYNKRQDGPGDELRVEVYSAIERIVENPYQYLLLIVIFGVVWFAGFLSRY